MARSTHIDEDKDEDIDEYARRGPLAEHLLLVSILEHVNILNS